MKFNDWKKTIESAISKLPAYEVDTAFRHYSTPRYRAESAWQEWLSHVLEGSAALETMAHQMDVISRMTGVRFHHDQIDAEDLAKIAEVHAVFRKVHTSVVTAVHLAARRQGCLPPFDAWSQGAFREPDGIARARATQLGLC